MKVCIFFDGQNFYRSLLRYDESLRVDYDRLATWITQAVGGPAAMFGGAYYYVGVSADAPVLVEGFLKGLELRPGYFVKREPARAAQGRCPSCGTEYEYTTEKRVDTRLVADLIHYAANNAYDAAVLVSGDDDFVPAVEAVNALGKQVWVATWSAEELSTDLRVRCFGHIRLSEGLGAFRTERVPASVVRPRPAAGAWAPRSTVARVAGGGIAAAAGPGPRARPRPSCSARRRGCRTSSRGYFVMRWKSHLLPPAGPEREQLVQQMLDAGLAEEFEVTDPDGRTVIARSAAAGEDGNVALPGQGA